MDEQLALLLQSIISLHTAALPEKSNKLMYFRKIITHENR